MQIRSHFYQLLSANTLVAVFGLLAGIILVRNLTVVDRGQLAEIFLWTSLGVTIGSESLREYILSLKGQESKVNLKTIILSAAIAITLPIILIVENGYKEYVYCSIIFSLLNFFSLIYLSKVQMNGDFRRLSIYKVIVPLINFVILLTSFYFSVGIWFALCSLLLSNLSLLVIISLNESFIAFSNTNKVSGYLCS